MNAWTLWATLAATLGTGCIGGAIDSSSEALGNLGRGDEACAEAEEFCDDGQADQTPDASEDGVDEDDDDEAEVDLPYDARPPLGSTFRLSDAFREVGPAPDEIVEVVMDGGGDWRIAELQSDAPFEITQEDCDHDGNRDIGRDRVFVTWRNPDGSTDTDHLDMRYCKD